MKTKLTLIAFFLTLSVTALIADTSDSDTSALKSLSLLVANKKPWTTVEANSEQRQPYYIGSTPRDFVLKGKLATHPKLPLFTQKLVECYSQNLLKSLNLQEVQFEIWPYLTDLGDPNWVFARYRKSASDPWRWMDSSDWKSRTSSCDSSPALPILMNPHDAKEAHLLFSDFPKFEILYQKPLFQEAVWTAKRAKTILGGWFSKEELPTVKKLIASDSTVRARILPQPARFNQDPVSFIVTATLSKPLAWAPSVIEWEKNLLTFPKVKKPIHQLKFADDFGNRFIEDVKALTGEKPVFHPTLLRDLRFSRKNSSQPDNQLLEVVSFLEARYRELGLETIRQSFQWRGIPQANLIAVIPGTHRALPPVVFADHFDTAIAEDHYTQTHERITNPGADDNATATATLLRAASELYKRRPHRDIWLLHLTGEEFPSDDLGARHFFKTLLQMKRDIAGMILVDMIGIREQTDPIYQINSGKTADSIALSGLAMEVAKLTPSSFVPAFRGRFSEESYLYNTDGYIADSLGFPVVFFNEHLNRKTIGKINHHYHQSTDTSDKLDLSYATYISQIAITTLWNAALQ